MCWEKEEEKSIHFVQKLLAASSGQFWITPSLDMIAWKCNAKLDEICSNILSTKLHTTAICLEYYNSHFQANFQSVSSVVQRIMRQ